MTGTPANRDVTGLLRAWRAGNDEAPNELFPLVYDELRRQARRYLERERPDHTLAPTALVHEAYMRMVDQTSPEVADRSHFYAIASRVMRQILVDHARRHKSEKRGAGRRIALDDLADIPAAEGFDLIGLDGALSKLEAMDARKCKVVELRFFGGLTEDEVADALNITSRTVRRDWQFAKLWLYRELSQKQA